MMMISEQFCCNHNVDSSLSSATVHAGVQKGSVGRGEGFYNAQVITMECQWMSLTKKSKESKLSSNFEKTIEWNTNVRKERSTS